MVGGVWGNWRWVGLGLLFNFLGLPTTRRFAVKMVSFSGTRYGFAVHNRQSVSFSLSRSLSPFFWSFEDSLIFMQRTASYHSKTLESNQYLSIRIPCTTDVLCTPLNI